MRYRLEDAGALALVRCDQPVVVIPPDGSLGLLIDTEARLEGAGVGGTLVAHGSAEEVLRRYRQDWAKMQRCDIGPEWAALLATKNLSASDVRNELRGMAADLEMVTIPVAELNEAMVEEINACMETSGRVGRLKERLETIRAEAPAAPSR